MYKNIIEDTTGMVNREWAYTMRRSMQEIVPGVFLGPCGIAGKKRSEELKNSGITHIVCARQEIEAALIKPYHPNLFEYLVITLADSHLATLLPWTREVNAFIKKCLLAGGKVLVYCSDGMSRSPALVTAYLMETYGIDFKTALSQVQEKRFCVQPNDGFEQQLIEFEPIYRARVEVKSRKEVEKRSRDIDDDDGVPEDQEGVKTRVVEKSQEMEM